MTNHIEELMKAAGLECSTPFTPAKQLELIKLLPNFRCQREWASDWTMDYIDVKTCKGFRACNLSFENTLAELIINLIVRKWIDKSEVKRILEDD